MLNTYSMFNYIDRQRRPWSDWPESSKFACIWHKWPFLHGSYHMHFATSQYCTRQCIFIYLQCSVFQLNIGTHLPLLIPVLKFEQIYQWRYPGNATLKIKSIRWLCPKVLMNGYKYRPLSDLQKGDKIFRQYYFPKGTSSMCIWRWDNVVSTRCNVLTLHRRWYDVSMLRVRWVYSS